MQWGLWFAGMMDARQNYRLSNCLPMYLALVVSWLRAQCWRPGGRWLCARGSRRAAYQVSCSSRWECTAFQYSGELCRYLLHNSYAENETAHRLRLALWQRPRGQGVGGVSAAARIPQILEFYAATERRHFAVQRTGQARSHRPHSPLSGTPLRADAGRLRLRQRRAYPQRERFLYSLRRPSLSPARRLARVQNDPASDARQPVRGGYTSAAETEKRVLRDVFAAGDSWVRTGDLMRGTRRELLFTS